MTKNFIKRRDFLKYVSATAAGIGLAGLENRYSKSAERDPIVPVYLPYLIRKSEPQNLIGRVVHIHAPNVTNWLFDYEQYFGKTQTSDTPGVNQAVVDAMIDRGVTGLLGLSSGEIVTAWNQLIPGYTYGKKVAIKVNFNNAYDCGTNTTKLNTIAQPINSVLRGLKMRGVRDQDIF